MKRFNTYVEDPFFKYTDEERCNMTREEYCSLIEEHNEYVRQKHQFAQLHENEIPKVNIIEELRAYYNCMPLDEAENKMNSLFDR